MVIPLNCISPNLRSRTCVLDKTLKGFRGVRRDDRKVLRAPGPRTKYSVRFLFLNKLKYITQNTQNVFLKI